MENLNSNTRNQILNTLNDQQKDFLMNHLKRGKKTVFALELARDKGIVLPEDSTVEELESLLSEWILDDYIVNDEVNPNTPCQCGRPLKYQYIVRHLSTNEVRRFGIKHFQEHTGLSPALVKSIMSGFNVIDYELDDILVKLSSGWSFQKEFYRIPEGLIFPNDIQQHLSLSLPLLDSQIKRLRLLIKQHVEPVKEVIEPVYKPVQNEVVPVHEDEQTSLFFEEFPSMKPKKQDNIKIELTQSMKQAILKYLQEGVTSSLHICVRLMNEQDCSTARYLTGKPKIYYPVCLYLESLVDQEIVTILDKDPLSKRNRLYQYIER